MHLLADEPVCADTELHAQRHAGAAKQSTEPSDSWGLPKIVPPTEARHCLPQEFSGSREWPATWAVHVSGMGPRCQMQAGD
jgi:hypothetical protein